MKQKLTHLITASLMLVLLMSFVNKDKWYLLESKDYGFKIEFPVEPKYMSQTINSVIGDIEMHIYLFDASESEDEDNMVYMVSHNEYPEFATDFSDDDSLDAFFRNAIDGAVSNVNGELISEEEIQLGKYPGREVKVDFQNGMAYIRMRIYLVENELYMLQTITLAEKDDNESISRFMDSFELIEK
jgi:hypothetical protein